MTIENNGIKCLKCGEVTRYKSYSSFTLHHLKKEHDLTAEEYYNNHICSDNKCGCGNLKQFVSIEKGYKTFCSDPKCSHKIEHSLEKSKHTKKEKYGDEYYVNREKAKQTCLEQYGSEYYTNRDKASLTCIERYGTTDMHSVPELAEKRKKTCLERYGDDSYVNKNQISISHKENFDKELKSRLKQHDCELVNYKSVKEINIKCNICGNVSKQNNKMIYYRNIINYSPCLTCVPMNFPFSSLENEISDFIKEHYDGEVLTNIKSIISPKELDIYLPELNLAFEVNGVFWHSDKFKERSYHKNKTDHCENIGIQLIHIFEDEWINNEALIKNKILYKLGKITNKIYGRNCSIHFDVPIEEQKSFYNLNHQQGYVQSKICLGLKYNDQYVAMMSFSNNRNKKYDYELNRFATLCDASVVGAASKLFKAFSKLYPNMKIISYADRCWSNGLVYESLGFIKDHISSPTYFYVDSVDMKRYNRFKFRKDSLKYMGYDVDGRTEKQIIDSETALFRIFNCGHIAYTIKT